MKTTLLFFPTFLGLGLLAATSTQAEYKEVVDLAHQLDRQAVALRKAADANFKHSGAHKHLVADANALIRLAQHLDELSHDRKSDFEHFKYDVQQTQKLIRHLQDLVTEMSAGIHGGHNHGDTRKIVRLTGEIDQTVAELQTAVIRHYGNGSELGSWWESFVQLWWDDSRTHKSEKKLSVPKQSGHGHGHSHGHSHSHHGHSH